MTDGAEWINARVALGMVVASKVPSPAETICARAYVGLVRSRAKLLVVEDQRRADVDVPTEFWWAKGHSALVQNWATGDFSTWIGRTRHLQAYGVSFRREDIVAMLPSAEQTSTQSIPAARVGGRPPASWWDDLWVEMVRQIYVGDLQPTKQSDIEHAMLTWIHSVRGRSAGTSTVRERARKLWHALSEGEK